MPEYRLYRLNAAGRVCAPGIEVMLVDDAEAVVEALRLDHADVIEIWCGKRLVTRVHPGSVESD